MAKSIEERLELIEARNKRVEEDKAWETSLTRRASIAVLTYTVFVVYLSIVGDKSPFINAVAPSVGFFLSTLLLGGIKDVWRRSRKTK